MGQGEWVRVSEPRVGTCIESFDRRGDTRLRARAGGTNSSGSRCCVRGEVALRDTVVEHDSPCLGHTRRDMLRARQPVASALGGLAGRQGLVEKQSVLLTRDGERESKVPVRHGVDLLSHALCTGAGQKGRHRRTVLGVDTRARRRVVHGLLFDAGTQVRDGCRFSPGNDQAEPLHHANRCLLPWCDDFREAGAKLRRAAADQADEVGG